MTGFVKKVPLGADQKIGIKLFILTAFKICTKWPLFSYPVTLIFVKIMRIALEIIMGNWRFSMYATCILLQLGGSGFNCVVKGNFATLIL